jgi:hypothetical protein
VPGAEDDGDRRGGRAASTASSAQAVEEIVHVPAQRDHSTAPAAFGDLSAHPRIRAKSTPSMFFGDEVSSPLSSHP